MKNLLKKAPLFVLVFVFIVAYSVADLATPERRYSELENRSLASFPEATVNTVIDGKWQLSYEDYISQQFLFRDGWITAKSAGELALLKTENNDIVYGQNGYMFPKFYKFNMNYYLDNLAAIDAFAAKSASPVSVMIVPSSYHALSDYVPAGLPYVDQGFYITQAGEYLSVNASAVNVKDILAANADKYIYYRTDHHWTSYGAWLGYTQFAVSAGFTPFDYNANSPKRVDGFFGTSYSKSKAPLAQPDTIEYFEFSATLTADGQLHTNLYDLNQFQRLDKYPGFLYGNNGLTVIETSFSQRKRESVLVIKDSFANALVPYLTENYNTIYMVDPRYYNGDLAELTTRHFNDVLILYGFETLATDTSVAKLGIGLAE